MSRWSSSRLARRAVVLVAVCTAVLIGAGPAGSQTGPEQQTGVGLVATGPETARAGTWFAAVAAPGETVTFTGQLVNGDPIDRRVRLSITDLEFDDDGRPVVEDASSSVGTWGRFDEPVVDVPGRSTRDISFRLTVPPGTDAGDHVGAVVVEPMADAAGAVGVVYRLARRLYVTVPGDVKPAVAIEKVRVVPEGGPVPRSATVTVDIRNTGTIRLLPTVTVDGVEAEGAGLLLSRSTERYTIERSVPWWGGPVDYDVKIATRTVLETDGPTAEERGSAFVFPTAIVLLVVLAALGAVSGRRLLKNRRSRVAALEAELAELRRRAGT